MLEREWETILEIYVLADDFLTTLFRVFHATLSSDQMEALVQSLVQEESVRFVEEVPWTFTYGTAGFRDKAEKLNRVLFRVGVLAALRSKVVGGICKSKPLCLSTVSPFPLQLRLE